jgi:CRISPR/Cas system-associated exonuclease Cas4 (RecB family)
MDICKELEKGIRTIALKHEWDTQLLHISDLGCWSGIEEKERKCPRALWYRLNGYPREADTPGKLLMFEQGRNLESFAITLLEAALGSQRIIIHPTVAIHTPVEKDIIWGEADVLLSESEDNRKVIVADIKTRRGNAFRFSNGVKATEKMQVLGYAYCLKEYKTIMGGAIIEVDREGQNFARVWDFDIGDDEYRQVEEAALEIRVIRTLPEPPQGINASLVRNTNKGPDSFKLKIPWQCKYCPYAKTCCDHCVPPEAMEYDGKVIAHIDIEGGMKQKELCGIIDANELTIEE